MTGFLLQISWHIITSWEEGNLFQFRQLLPLRTPVKSAAFISEVKSNDANGEWKQKALVRVAEFTPPVKAVETKNMDLKARISLSNSERGSKAMLWFKLNGLGCEHSFLGLLDASIQCMIVLLGNEKTIKRSWWGRQGGMARWVAGIMVIVKTAERKIRD